MNDAAAGSSEPQWRTTQAVEIHLDVAETSLVIREDKLQSDEEGFLSTKVRYRIEHADNSTRDAIVLSDFEAGRLSAALRYLMEGGPLA